MSSAALSFLDAAASISAWIIRSYRCHRRVCSYLLSRSLSERLSTTFRMTSITVGKGRNSAAACAQATAASSSWPASRISARVVEPLVRHHVEDPAARWVAGLAESRGEAIGVCERDTSGLGVAVGDRLAGEPGLVQEAGHVHVLQGCSSLVPPQRAQEADGAWPPRRLGPAVASSASVTSLRIRSGERSHRYCSRNVACSARDSASPC